VDLDDQASNASSNYDVDVTQMLQFIGSFENPWNKST
jgi:hypothetical protein